MPVCMQRKMRDRQLSVEDECIGVRHKIFDNQIQPTIGA